MNKTTKFELNEVPKDGENFAGFNVASEYHDPATALLAASRAAADNRNASWSLTAHYEDGTVSELINSDEF